MDWRIEGMAGGRWASAPGAQAERQDLVGPSQRPGGEARTPLWTWSRAGRRGKGPERTRQGEACCDGPVSCAKLSGDSLGPSPQGSVCLFLRVSYRADMAHHGVCQDELRLPEASLFKLSSFYYKNMQIIGKQGEKLLKDARSPTTQREWCLSLSSPSFTQRLLFYILAITVFTQPSVVSIYCTSIYSTEFHRLCNHESSCQCNISFRAFTVYLTNPPSLGS